MQVFHFNDYPPDPPRETINDSHRVYPGDGIAPLDDILNGFAEVGATPVLSLEVFNRSYWEQDAAGVAKTGLRKMQSAVKKALG
jgi:2-keto-myo-inositol isomerase